MDRPLLFPRSHLQAAAQIVFGVLLFYFFPELIPDWHYIPLMLLVTMLMAMPRPRRWSRAGEHLPAPPARPTHSGPVPTSSSNNAPPSRLHTRSPNQTSSSSPPQQPSRTQQPNDITRPATPSSVPMGTYHTRLDEALRFEQPQQPAEPAQPELPPHNSTSQSASQPSPLSRPNANTGQAIPPETTQQPSEQRADQFAAMKDPAQSRITRLFYNLAIASGILTEALGKLKALLASMASKATDPQWCTEVLEAVFVASQTSCRKTSLFINNACESFAFSCARTWYSLLFCALRLPRIIWRRNVQHVKQNARTVLCTCCFFVPDKLIPATLEDYVRDNSASFPACANLIALTNGVTVYSSNAGYDLAAGLVVWLALHASWSLTSIEIRAYLLLNHLLAILLFIITFPFEVAKYLICRYRNLLIGLALCLAHFLAFTLALTTFAPLLSTYGSVLTFCWRVITETPQTIIQNSTPILIVI